MSRSAGDKVPTMVDVARRAGVSPSTVSYAMTGSRPISEATRLRIQQAMLDLGYRPNVFARGLKSKRSHIIAVLFPKNEHERGMNLGSMEYIFGASDHAQDRGYHLLLWTSGADALDDLAGLAQQGLVDGVLLMEVRLKDPRIEVLRNSELIFTMLGQNADPGDLDYVDTDFDQCARLAVDHLTALGHRHLGFINLGASALEAGRGNAIRLRDGVLGAAASARAQVTTLTCESSIGGGRGALTELLLRDRAVTAVIAFNEQAVPGIMSAAADRGLRIPADLSILSIDMPAQAALMTTPAMTTVGPTAAAMGRAAVAMLIRQVEGAATGVTQMLFDGELVLRESTGPAADHDTA